MQNQEIIKIIEDLKGRKSYEQKKAFKLGFTSLYSYFEDKLYKQEKKIEVSKEKIEEMDEVKTNDEFKNKEKKNCSCC